MPVSDVILRRAIALTLERPNEAAIVDGYVTPGLGAISAVVGHMQPLSPKEMRLVPEGQTHLEWWHVWSLSELKVDDIISDAGLQAVTVMRVEFWKEGAFYHAQGTRLKDYTLLPGGQGAAVFEITASATGEAPTSAAVFAPDFSSDFS